VRRIVIITVAVLAFAAASIAITLVLVPGQNERTDVLKLIREQARGDIAAMLAQLSGCAQRPACLADARADATTLRQSGNVELVNFQPSTTIALGSTGGFARVAWNVGSRIPVVQCVQVHRGSGLFGARRVTLLAVSRPIASQATCP
jgi:hypothetical protein